MSSPTSSIKHLKHPRAAEAAGLALVLAGAVVLYSGCLRGFFVQDDFGWLESTRFRSFGEYAASFFRFNNSLTYRPLSQETFFWLGQKVFGLWPAGFHLVSLTLHLLGSALVYLLLRKFVSVLPALVGALFYAVHPAHLWAVYWISALPEPLALVFFVTAMLLFIRFDRTGDRGAWWGSFAAMLLGMGSKESILSLPLVLALYCLLYARQRLVWTWPFFAVSASYTVLRLTSLAVAAAPYPLTFGREAWDNLLHYLAWSSGFTDTLVGLKLEWDAEAMVPVLAACFVAAAIVSSVLARDRRAVLFGALWFGAALQPVLYFSGHIYPYYLAPAIPAFALVLAAGLQGLAPRLRVPVMLVLVGLFSWAASGSIRGEGRWWNDRSFQARAFVRQLRAVDLAVPPGHKVYIAGLEPEELGTLQEDAVLKAFGFSMQKYILFRLSPETPAHIRHLHATGEIRNFHLYVVHGWRMEDWTAEFRQDPEPFLLLAEGYLDRPDVKVEIEPKVARAGRDTVKLRVHNFTADSIDVFYTFNGEFRPPFRGWRLGPDHTSEVALGSATPRGHYYYLAIRDSSARGPDSWIRTYCFIEVQ